MRISAVLLLALLCHVALSGEQQDGVEALSASVVKITSNAPEGPTRTGTGFVVRVDEELIYIATAYHVVEGDSKPQVTFYHDKRRPVAAEIGDFEADKAGLGFLIVRDRAIARRVGVLPWSAGVLRGGENVSTVGFGQGAGPWGVTKGTVASVSGSNIRINGTFGEGNSGGPIILNGSVAGMLTDIEQGFGIGKPAAIVKLTLEGWDVEVSAPFTNQRVMLVNTQTAKCLTIAGGRSTDNNVTAVQFDCDGDPSRSWSITAAGRGVYQISNVQTRKCLTIAGGLSTDNNVEALQFDCDSDPSRTWKIIATGDGVYQISNVQTGKCLTIAGGRSTDNSVTALQFDCDTDPSRTWRIRP